MKKILCDLSSSNNLVVYKRRPTLSIRTPEEAVDLVATEAIVVTEAIVAAEAIEEIEATEATVEAAGLVGTVAGVFAGCVIG